MIAQAGCPKSISEGEQISESLEKLLDDRDELLPQSLRKKPVPVVEGVTAREDQVFSLIRSGGEILGAVFLIPRDARKTMGDIEKKLTAVAAEFLGRQAAL